MNLDSTVCILLHYEVQTTIAELVEAWDDGEIAELLEDDPEALETLEEEAIEFAQSSESEIEEVEVE